ncbi:hypothetical protein MNB_SV-8-1453 [hydrothermal vent metagenome]|uniref:Pesticidal crystal protein Cry22Aa Ig-like domain-containing protein n=1 Tax=hydrothermal vent metagenome TaxID=652676 RepID=A0A1W1BJA0_9ZZZZ
MNVTAGNAPVITLNGDNPYSVEVHTTYTDPGATATDTEDGNVPVTNDSATAVNMAVVGDYMVTYTSTDSQNNTTHATRTVKVVDTTAPVITLTGNAAVNLLVGATYTEEGATCTDNYDANCNVTIGGDTVDTSTVGTYTVTYDANDTAGNTATQVTRSVNVTAVVTDTDGDGIPDATDPDDDNDGVADADDAFPLDANEIADTDGDGIGNNADTDSWFTYNSATRTVTVTPTGSTEDSVIQAENGDATVVPAADSITLKVQNANGCTAFIKALDDGSVITGYEGTCQNAGDTTDGTFPIGTRSVIAQGGASIESTVKLNMNESFIIGGK